MQELLRALGIHYETLDAGLVITAQNPDFWTYLNIEIPKKPVELEEVFPEIIGAEDDIRKIIDSGKGKYHLPYLSRNQKFMHLTIVAECGSNCAVIVAEDVTNDAQERQLLLQRKNEITQLQMELKEKNTELEKVNSKLDSLINIVRIQNHDLDIKVKQRTKELNDSRLSVITTLARAAEFRDIDTGGHIYRIGRSSVILAKKYGLSSADCESLFYSSLLHDLGKIGISDSILLKPGPLSKTEWTLMKDHTTIGAKLLGDNDDTTISSARDIALYHHEKWDGSGYPFGLSGEKIPILGRICAIVDVFDALLSKRPYKNAFSQDKAVDIILTSSEKHFDPDIVAAFRDVLDDILRLQTEAAEDLESLPPGF